MGTHLITILDTTTSLYASTSNTYFTTIIMRAQSIVLFMLLAVFSLGMGKPYQERHNEAQEQQGLGRDEHFQNNMHDKRGGRDPNEDPHDKIKRGMMDDENMLNKRNSERKHGGMAKRGMMGDDKKREMMENMQRRGMYNEGKGNRRRRSLNGMSAEVERDMMQKRSRGQRPDRPETSATQAPGRPT